MKTQTLTKLIAVTTLVFAAVLALFVAGGGEDLPKGPVPIVWDKESCAECRMLVGQPSFAAQVQRKDGSILNFDDPGCALRFLTKSSPEDLHAVYFHHAREDRWLKAEDTAFAKSFNTPMGSGLGALDRETPSTMTRDEATALIVAQGSTP